MRTAFDNMADTITHQHYQAITVSDSDYRAWQDQWLFDKIGGQRLGQSFCNYFNIANSTPLFHFRDETICLNWIRSNYLEK